MRLGSILLLTALVFSILAPITVSAADVLQTKYATVLDFDRVHQALDYTSGSMVPSGGDFWIADRTPNSLAHNWEGGGNTEGIIDMGLKKFDEVTEAPATGYQTDAVAQEGHTYVTSSPGKHRYGKFYIDDVVKAGDRPGLTVTEFSIRYAYQPDGSRNLVTGTAQPPISPPPPPSGCNWAGTWDTYDVPSLGGKYLDTLYFQQVGNQLTVTYKNYSYRKIIGTVSGSILTGTWGDSPPYTQGIADITMSTDCNSITGRWRWHSSAGWEGTWVGTRQSIALPPQPPTVGGTSSSGTAPAGGGLYENYKGSPDIGGDVRMNYWHGQIFTSLANHQVNSVKLLAYRIGNPGTLIVSIRATNSSGHPTGSDLASGTTGGDTLPLSQPGEWREITFSQPVSLTAGTKYAIVARAPGGGGGNAVKWLTDGTAPDYVGGNRESSGDSGANWQSDFNSDYLFELWGPISGSTGQPAGSSGTASGCSWAGIWDAYEYESGQLLGTMTIVQSGNRVTVNYDYRPELKIMGTLSDTSPNVVDGTWGRAPLYDSNPVRLVLVDDCSEINGFAADKGSSNFSPEWYAIRHKATSTAPAQSSAAATGTGTSAITGANTGTQLIVESRTALLGDTILVPVRLENAQSMGSLGYSIKYDPVVIQFIKADKGAIMPADASFIANSPQQGTIILAYAASSSIKGSGTTAQIEFKAIGVQGSQSALTLSDVTATGSGGGQIAVNSVNGQVTIGQKIKGDGTGDGQVTVLDALMALKMYVKAITENLVLDVNNDGKVTPEDARLILNMAKPK